MTDKARQARNKRLRDRRLSDPEYRERCNTYHSDWCHRNPDKVKQYQNDYWERQADAEEADNEE